MNPCKGHNCDWCRTCRRGDCCGRDKAPDATPAKPGSVPVRCAMTEPEAATVVFDGGPRDGETDTVHPRAVVIGTGKEGGVYQRTYDEQRDGLQVYRWQVLTDAEAAALLRGDLRANQEPDG